MPLETMITLLMRGTFFLLLFIAVIYTLLLGYHWFTYGSQKHTAMVALIVYLTGTSVCFLLMGSLLLYYG